MISNMIRKLWFLFYNIANKINSDVDWYFITTRWLFSLSNNQFIRLLYKKKLFYTNALLNELNLSCDEKNEKIGKTLWAYFLMRLWGENLINVAPIKIEGQEYLAQAKSGQKGIILIRSHQLLVDELSSWIYNILKIDASIGRSNKASRDEKKFIGPLQASVMVTQELIAAKKILINFGIVEVLPDGNLGVTGKDFSFYNRIRRFRTGFAELAVNTNSYLLPIWINLDSSGRVIIKFSALFDINEKNFAEQEIDSLLEQYVNYLKENWQNNPEMISFATLRKHFENVNIN